jgi:transposase-like protein
MSGTEQARDALVAYLPTKIRGKALVAAFEAAVRADQRERIAVQLEAQRDAAGFPAESVVRRIVTTCADMVRVPVAGGPNGSWALAAADAAAARRRKVEQS